jgi:acyl-CoA synthetase (NDP forming)
MSTFTKFINPKSIAIVGASRSKEKVGYQVLHNLIEGGFSGKLYPINPNADSILKLKTFPTLSAIKKPVDLAIIITPAALVAPIIAECAENRIGNAIIISAGFAESGPKGAMLQQELAHTLIQSPVSVLGPNCLGVLSPVNKLNAAFGPPLPQTGKVMLISQSGALVTGIIDWAKMMDIGLSHAISFGNRIQSGEIEALEYAASDKHTQAILLYLESFSSPHRLFSLASQITPKKPIIFLKGGQSLAGQSASASHTAALASNYILTSTFAKQAGIIVADTIEEWLNLAAAFVHVPPASTTDLTIVTNAGGPGVLSTDEASGLNLNVPDLPPSLKQKISQALPRISPHNPLDILGDATPEDLTGALAVIKTEPKISNLLTIVTPQTTTRPLDTAQAIVDSSLHKKIPTYAVFIGGEKMAKAKQLLRKNHLLTFDFPTQALAIIAAKSRYETSRHKIPLFPAAKPNFITKEDKIVLTQKLQSPLTLATAFDLLTRYGFTLPKSAIIDTITEVPEALSHVGKPAVIKTAGLNIIHKAAVGGVSLNVMTPAIARLAYRRLRQLHPEVLFQQTILGELELILGTKRDPQFGPFITFGLGGTLTNTVADRGYVFVPATKTAIMDMVKSTRAYDAISKKGLPLDPVIGALQRLSAILLDLPEIDELEINPAILTKKHLYAADIKVTLKK